MLDGDVPHANLAAIVEPFFLGAGKDSPAGKVFNAWADEQKEKHGIAILGSVADLKLKGKTLALVSGRTADNPRLLKELINAGVTHIFLEKPGAPTVAELEHMKEYAASKGVPVYMGYNKNVAKYVHDALEFEKKTPGATTTFVHNNAYKKEELPECFERNAEGMLKNMAIHELALLATFYGVRVDNIESIKEDHEFTDMETLTGPHSGKEFTDFAKVGFTVVTKSPKKTVTVKADRCGCDDGGHSFASVSVDGVEKFRSETPDKNLKKICDKKAREDPEMMPYFALQHDDYITLKERATAHILSGAQGSPEGMATIDIAVEALKTAEYLTPLLKKEAR
jgi:predicted dehydrogenase